MAVSGMFLLWYGAFRFFVEFYRVPDADFGYLAFGWVTMGQVSVRTDDRCWRVSLTFLRLIAGTHWTGRTVKA